MTITPLIGAKAFLIFEGDPFDSDAEPGMPGVGIDTDPADIAADEWRSLGCIVNNDYADQKEGEIKTYCPDEGGAMVLRNTKYTTFSSILNITLEDLTVDMWNLIFGVGDMDGSFIGTPGSRTALQRGWLKLQHYDNTGDPATANVCNLQWWCEFDVANATVFDKANQTQATLTCNKLPNVNNSIQFLNSATTGA